MSHLRNVALSLLALACLAPASYAGNTPSGNFTATYLGPANTTANGAPLVCAAVTNCSMIRDGIVTPGESRIAITLVTNVDGLNLHVEIGGWAAAMCGPDPTTPDLTGSGDLPLPTAGRWVISLNTEAQLPAGTTYSQKWAVSAPDLSIDCGVSFCVNSLAGNPGAAPADCDQP